MPSMKPQDYSNKYFEHMGGGNGKVIVQEIPENQGYFWIGEVFKGVTGKAQIGDQFFVAHESRMKPQQPPLPTEIEWDMIKPVAEVREKLAAGTHVIKGTRLVEA